MGGEHFDVLHFPSSIDLPVFFFYKLLNKTLIFCFIALN